MAIEHLYGLVVKASIAPFSFMLSLLLYGITGSAMLVSVLSKVCPSGSWTTFRRWLASRASQPIKLPCAGDLAIAFDNDQIVQKQYEVKAGGKPRVSILTSVCYVVFGLRGLQLQQDLAPSNWMQYSNALINKEIKEDLMKTLLAKERLRAAFAVVRKEYICECILDCASKRCGCQKRNKTCNSSCRCKSSQCINRHDTITRASDEDDHANKSTMKVTKKEIANDGVDPSPLARTEDEIGNDNITEPLQKKETNTSKQNGRGGGINSTFNWNTKEHSWTDQVFAEVTSRLDANSGGHKKKKYSVTVNKLKRRMSAPERMSRNTVTKYLRLDSGKGLGRESVNRLFNSLNHNDSGRGAKSTAFTLLTEGEVKDLAHSILAVGSTTVTCAQLIEEKNEEGGILHKANFIAARYASKQSLL
ncbi:uncharacterized protein [Ptychodera flava]|uniref:uncharacterized protein isoform X1 n=1 Tax=Ptychodera flava TaxID=63121 RepID=UPI003969C1F0